MGAVTRSNIRTSAIGDLVRRDRYISVHNPRDRIQISLCVPSPGQTSEGQYAAPGNLSDLGCRQGA